MRNGTVATLAAVAVGAWLILQGATVAVEAKSDESPSALMGSYPSPENPTGWRGNWKGIFPNYNPPTNWSRVIVEMKGLRSQPGRPKGDGPEDSAPLTGPDYMITDWLVLDSIPIKRADVVLVEKEQEPNEQKRNATNESARIKMLDDETIPDEAGIRPNTGEQAPSAGSEQAGAAQWKLVNVFESTMSKPVPKGGYPPNCLEAAQICVYPKIATGQVSFAHAYVYSERDMEVCFYLRTGPAKVWLNGKVVKTRGKGEESPFRVSFVKGWNRILVKSFGAMSSSFGPVVRPTFETTNVKWMTKLPERLRQDCNASLPIVVGEKIYMTYDHGDLLCIDRKTGAILWNRSNHFYETLSEEEKKDYTARYTTVETRVSSPVGKSVTIMVSQGLDPASAKSLDSYQIPGMKLEKVELTDSNKCVRLTATESFVIGKEYTLKLSGLKSSQGEPPDKTEWPLIAVPRKPLLNGDLIKEFLVSDAKPGGDSRKVVLQEIPDEKSLKPKAGDGWKQATADDGRFNLIKILKAKERGQSIVYMRVWLYSHCDRSARFSMAYSDGLRVVVNGALVEAKAVGRSVGLEYFKSKFDDLGEWGEYQVKNVPLVKGWNRVLVGVTQSDNLWGFSLRVLDENGKPAIGLGYTIEDPETGGDAQVEYAEPPPTRNRKSMQALKRAEELMANLKEADKKLFDALNATPQEAYLKGISSEKQEEFAKLIESKAKIGDELMNSMVTFDRYRFKPPKQEWGYCNPTPVSDGKRVYVWITTGVAAAFDLDGNPIWKRHITRANFWDHGNHASPVLADGKFVVQRGNAGMYTHGAQCLDAATGKTLWAIDSGLRWGEGSSCSVVKIGGESVMLGWMNIGLRISDGKQLFAIHDNGGRGTASPLIANGNFYHLDETGVYQSRLPDSLEGADKKQIQLVAQYHMLNKVPGGMGGTPSPLVWDGIFYAQDSMAHLSAFDMEGKKELYTRDMTEFRIREGSRYYVGTTTSPALLGKYIYLGDNSGITVVMAPGREYKRIAVNVLENRFNIYSFRGNWWYDQTGNVTSWAFEGNDIFIRDAEYLYCIGGK